MLPKEKRSPDQEHKEISKRQVAEEKLRKVIAEETRSDRNMPYSIEEAVLFLCILYISLIKVKMWLLFQWK